MPALLPGAPFLRIDRTGSIANLIAIEAARRRSVFVCFAAWARSAPVTRSPSCWGSCGSRGSSSGAYYTDLMPAGPLISKVGLKPDPRDSIFGLPAEFRARTRLACVLLSVTAACAVAQASPQTTRPPARRAAAPPVEPKKESPELSCPAPLGTGVTTHRSYCDVLSGRNPAEGILITIPPHSGPVTLTFDLHNRHTYSEEQMKDPRTAFARYSAGIGVLTMDNTLISRAAVQNEFRKPSDLIERIGGGAGPAGVKAVAPTGLEPVTIMIPEAENQVSILGEKLTVDRADGSVTYTSAGRPIAIISNVMIEYQPPRPARRPPARRAPRRSSP